MKEIPILFSTPMVQAILQGRKTQTRRIPIETISIDKMGNLIMGKWNYGQHLDRRPQFENLISLKSRWKIGDVLWVRETFRKYCHVDENGYTRYDKEIIEFAADNPPMLNEVDGDGCLMFKKDGSEKFIPWRPSIHMPKNAARIWLHVTNVRVERLQDISEEDAKAEGVEMITGGAFPYKHYGNDSASCANAIASFESLWREINGDESWEANPLVWAISFKTLSTTGKP